MHGRATDPAQGAAPNYDFKAVASFVATRDAARATLPPPAAAPSAALAALAGYDDDDDDGDGE